MEEAGELSLLRRTVIEYIECQLLVFEVEGHPISFPFV